MIAHLKNFYREDYKLKFILGIIFLTGYFLMFFMTPMRLDDLTWGSTVGIQRLQSWFDGYNGRYIGNIIVIILTRLPAAFRAIVQIAFVFYFFKTIYNILNKHLVAFFTTLILLLLMPLEIFSQSVSWVSGFANYFVSSVSILIVLRMELAIILDDKQYRKISLFFLYIICFGGQLILETSTVYICALTLSCLIIYSVRYRKVSITTVIAFILSVLGAITMFSNTAYWAAFQGDSSITYKNITLSANFLDLIQKCGSTFVNTIVPKWTGNSSVLNIILAICLILINKYNKKNSSKLHICMQSIGIIFFTFFLYDIVDIQIFSWGKYVWAIISLAFWGYLSFTTFIAEIDPKTRLILAILCFSQPILIGPLLFVNPIGERCFFQTYIFSVLTTGYLIIHYMQRCATNKTISTIVHKGSGYVVFFLLCLLIASQTQPWHIEKIRKEEIKNCIENGNKTLVLPNIPYSTQYCYGANISNNNEYWLTNYKNYWGIPENVQLSFVDYPYWKTLNKEHYND